MHIYKHIELGNKLCLQSWALYDALKLEIESKEQEGWALIRVVVADMAGRKTYWAVFERLANEDFSS
jgi:hypothetical protein